MARRPEEGCLDHVQSVRDPDRGATFSLMADTPERAAVIWAPGRVNLIGEHTDYSGGLVLPVAIEFGITLEALTDDEEVTLSSSDFEGTHAFAADGSGEAVRGWARYAQAVAAELALVGRPPVGLTGSLSSDLLAGSGLSSSAALEVAVALALCAVARFELDPLELARACQRAELRAVGVPCGILDQAACLLGREGSAIMLDCGTLEHHLVTVPPGCGLFIADSGVERSLENTAYAERRAQLEHALGLVGAARSTEVDVSDLQGLDDVSRRRLRHVVTENERVRQFAAALEHDDLATAGRLLGESHSSLRDDYEVSIPELDLLVRLAEAAGAFGARLVGGGFGGSVLVLTDAGRSDTVAATMRAEYRRQTGRDSRTLAVHPSSGAVVR
jgi:galactokinase